MRTISKWILIMTVGLIVSTSTLFIQIGTDDSESATIGVQKKWGFPITYRTTASGLAWADYSALRFAVNTFTWVVFIAAAGAVIQRITKRGSNNTSEGICR